MEKLIKPAEYAKEMGISRQAVYAKIKRGILKSKNIEGKLYIIIDNVVKKEPSKATDKNTKKANIKPDIEKEYTALLQSKDETISVLKGTVKELKKSNKQISTTLKGEIDLIKEAFHEMRTLYVRQIEQKKSKDTEIEITTEEDTIEIKEESWIGVKKFFKQHNIKKEKQQQKVIKRFKKALKKNDERFQFINKKIKINNTQNYKDILD